MTTEELIEYYRKLLILQYDGKDKNDAFIEALVSLVVASQIYTEVQNAFDVNSAVGVQLDVIGKYAGVTRNANTFSGPVVFDDDDFRLMIKAAIVKNNFGSSLYDIQNLLNQFFAGTIIVVDYANMRLSYLFDAALGSEQLAEAFIVQGLLPKPMGVQLASVIYIDDITNVFGFVSYEVPTNPVISGFNNYVDYDEAAPWIRYENAIYIV